MDYSSGDYSLYPGSDKQALKVDFASLTEAAQKLNVAVTFYSGGSYFSPSRRLINIDTKSPNQRGFVSLGHLSVSEPRRGEAPRLQPLIGRAFNIAGRSQVMGE
jgi:hypothetical protein